MTESLLPRFLLHAKNFLAVCAVLFVFSAQANVGQPTLIHHSSTINCDEVLAWSESDDNTDYARLDDATTAASLTPSPLVGEGWGEGFFSTPSPVVGEGRGEGHSVTSLKAQKSAVHYEPITNLFHSLHEQQLIQITLDSGETITATAGHPMRTTEGWHDAVLLKRWREGKAHRGNACGKADRFHDGNHSGPSKRGAHSP